MNLGVCTHQLPLEVHLEPFLQGVGQADQGGGAGRPRGWGRQVKGWVHGLTKGVGWAD